MKLTIQMKLLPSVAQKALLLETMRRFNAAASHAARVGFEAKVFSQVAIHKRCYQELRERFGISAQMAVRAIGKAVEVFRRDKGRCPVFKPRGAMTYDERFFSFKGPAAASLLTVGGRQLIPMVYGSYQKERFDRIKGQVDLVHRKGRFFLYATIDLPDGSPVDPEDFLGVDLGVKNVAVTSDGEFFGGGAIEGCRRRQAKNRASMQRKASKAKSRKRLKGVRRALRRASGKEARFRRDVNHRISKRIVLLAKDTGRGIALENLKGIRGRTRFRKAQRARMGSWAFSQLRQFVEYKARVHGVHVSVVDPRNTSRACGSCGHCEKANRPSQELFRCKACGFQSHADLNAARNIRAKAVVNPPQASDAQRMSVA